MEFYTNLPRNKKEFIIFMVLISVVSVNIIAPLVTFFEIGFHFSIWVDTLKVIPFIWVTVIALVLITYKPAEWFTHRVVKEGDSFGVHILINILFSVLLMSVFLTVIGSWIGNRHISIEPIRMFFYKWPRNFAIALFVEACIAQPIARFAMRKIHMHQDLHEPTELIKFSMAMNED
jgi:hypothetical protein